jgi:hypothetical protein
MTTIAAVTTDCTTQTASQYKANIDNNSLLFADAGATVDSATGLLTLAHGLAVSGELRMSTRIVSTLPAAATVGAGARSFVIDALTPVWGATVAGSGAMKVPVYSDGVVWKVG